MDDSARRGRPEDQIEGRVSSVESIVTPRSHQGDRPNLADVFQTLQQAQRETNGYATDEKILRAYVHALERVYPEQRFTLRISREADHKPPIQHATHRIAEDAQAEVTITEAGLARMGVAGGTLAGVGLRRTYAPILGAASGEELAVRDGLDAPLSRNGEIVGVLAAEFDRRAPLPNYPHEALLITAAQVSSALDSSHVKREAVHLRDYLEKLLEHASIPVLVIGRDRGIRVMSGAFGKITGLRPREVVAKDLLHLAPKNERVRVLSAFVSALRGRTVPPFELQLPKEGSGTARLQFKLAPILDSEGRVAGVIAIGQDRTEVRELEGQVIQAEKLATLGQLAAGIVHEINNPLTSISVYGEYLLDRLEKTGAEESDVHRVERILRSADRIMDFTRNLLTYARPSEEEAQEVDVNTILEEAVGFCEHTIVDASAGIVRSYAEDLPSVRAVRGQLHQVFVNLITNAVSYTHLTLPTKRIV